LATVPGQKFAISTTNINQAGKTKCKESRLYHLGKRRAGRKAYTNRKDVGKPVTGTFDPPLREIRDVSAM
jgi:hypothetical protein